MAIGDIVLVHLDTGVIRPMLVTAKDLHYGDPARGAPELRLSGTLFCEPDDHATQAFRSLLSPVAPARIHGRPDRTAPCAYGESLREGTGIGEWVTRPTNLPAGR